MERVLTFSMFEEYVSAMRQAAGVAHSDWDAVRDKLRIDSREVLVR